MSHKHHENKVIPKIFFDALLAQMQFSVMAGISKDQTSSQVMLQIQTANRRVEISVGVFRD